MRRGVWRCAHATQRGVAPAPIASTPSSHTLSAAVSPSLAPPVVTLQTRWLSRAAHSASAHRSAAARSTRHDGISYNDEVHRSNSSIARRIRHHAQPPTPPGAAPKKTHRPGQQQQQHQQHQQPQKQQHRPRPRLRIADQSVAALVSKRTSPKDFLAACRTLAAKDSVVVLAGTDLVAWNVALQHRLIVGDVTGARTLLALVGSFDAENASVQLWTDLLFTVLRQPSALSDGNEVKALLDALRDTCGADFVADVLVSTVNGCANIKMFDQAQFLVLYHLELDTAAALPPRIVGTLVSAMAAKRRDADVVAFTADLFSHPQFKLADFQQQGFLALFRSYTRLGEPPTRVMPRFLQWFDANAVRLLANSHDAFVAQHFERVFGAAIQCCVETGSPKLALRCYDAMTNYSSDVETDIEAETEIDSSTVTATMHTAAAVPVDENIYVNVLKACATLADAALFRDVYRSMVAAGVARGPGFGSAIRFCSTTRDAAFLDEVLADAFAVEDALRGAWLLDVAQYNDALGCFAACKQFERGQALFALMAANPFLVPDHVTMLEVVENHREAPFSDVFNVMELFLEWDLRPTLQVFTSLLATCARRRLVGDALALLDAMRDQGIVPDVKAFTVVAFVLGTHADVAGIVALLASMARDHVATDQLFFDYTLNALYGASGIDVCFSLVRELHDADLAVPEGLYNALVDVGTRAGLVERTLHVAYNMECDGFTLSSARMQALVARCGSTPELAELLRTFELLHQGAQTDGTPRFEREVYDDLVDVLARFAKKDAIPKVKALAAAAGHDMPQ